jgi:ABC-type transport system involved in cytochrome c biogenesis permease subunit
MISSTALFTGSLIVYLSAFLASAAAFATGSISVRRVGTALVGTGMLVHLASLALLWQEHGSFPAGTTQGFFGSYAIFTFFWALLIARHWKIENTYFAFMVIPLVMLVGIRVLHPTKVVTSTMGPVFRGLHLLAIVSSLAAFTVSFTGGLMLFVQDRLMKAKAFGFLMENLPPLDVLDEMTYRNVSFGFIALSLGALLGFAAAPKAWGASIPLDLRVAVSLAAWAMYGFYLHTRTRRGWRGRKLAVVSLAGFLVILATSMFASYSGGIHGS